ncbi:MAG: nucleotide exchange factor GrpE, partial [Phototrophicales bacterium]
MVNQEEQISSIHKGEELIEEDATYKPHADPEEVRKRHKKAAAPKQKNSARAEGSSAEERDALANKLEQLRKEYAELDDKYKRLWADQQNMSKRMNREREDMIKYAALSTIEAILP